MHLILFALLLQVHPVPTKKLAPEIPTPQFVIVDTYERDYSPTFGQPASYLRARGGTNYRWFWFRNSLLLQSNGVYKYVFFYAARSELGEFVEYDLDNEDDDWLYEFDKDNKELSPEK